MERVLVTGATGGLGRVLVPALAAQECKIVVTGRRADVGRALEGPRVVFRAADLARDPIEPLVAGADTVFHLAAFSSPWGPPAAFETANVTATQRLLQAARRAGCRCFIHVSTPSIYTDTRDRLSLTEDSPLPPRWANDYARTKYAAEQLVRAAASASMNTVVLRPRAIVSPFDTILLPRLLRAARRKAVRLPNGGQALVELTDARDVVAALLAAAVHAGDVNSQAFNISGGSPLPIAEVVALVLRALGRPLRIRSMNARVALLLASLAETVAGLLPSRPEPPLTRYGVMIASWSQTFDLTAARARLQWAPRYSPEAAVRWALAGMKHA